MQIKNAVKRLLIRRLDREYENELAKRKVSYDAWVNVCEQKMLSEAPMNPQRDILKEQELILFLQRRGKLHVAALQYIENHLSQHEECMLLYGDEDMVGADGVRRNPWYKPCWSPDLYLDCFYPGSVVVVKRALAERIIPAENLQETFVYFDSPDELRELFDKLFLAAGGFERGCKAIARVPQILFHAEDDSLWGEYLQSASTMKLEKNVCSGLISVIIPSKDNPKVLEKCLKSLEECMARQDMEIIVVDNGSSAENRVMVEELTKGMTYLYNPMEFNFSAMCNIGAKQARGDLLLFLNDDIEMRGTEWLERMTAKAVQPYVGAVGLKLCYPDSIKIQHAGITNLPVGPVHKLQMMEDDICYYFGWNKFSHNCLAVTGACFMVRREQFFEVGGFREELRVAYNDVDMGFRLWEMGYQNVVVNQCFGIHHESLSRGDDETWEKQRRLERERKLLYEWHPKLCGKDPYYPEQLNIEGLDCRIQPGFVSSGNTVQKSCWKELPEKLTGYREDPCLMVRVETSGPERIQGYSVVLGDNNACYSMYLILESEEQSGRLLYMRLEAQYRDDLETNLPDQRNVALGGFRVSRLDEGLAPGNYRIGLLAVRRIGGLKLLNWSGKSLWVEEAAKE